MSDKELVVKKSVASGWDAAAAAVMVAAVIMLPEMTLAGGTAAGGGQTGGGGQVESVLCRIIQMLTGALGKAIATLAIIIIGIGALMGKVSWGMAIIVAIGVAVVFGAGQIVQLLAGGAGATATCGTSLAGGTGTGPGR